MPIDDGDRSCMRDLDWLRCGEAAPRMFGGKL
jgi:hypothetical protein